MFDRVLSLRRCRRGYRPFHSNVIGVAAGEAPFVLDGLAGNAAEFDPLVHHVGTGGVVPGPDCSLTDCYGRCEVVVDRPV